VVSLIPSPCRRWSDGTRTGRSGRVLPLGVIRPLVRWSHRPRATGNGTAEDSPTGT